MPKKIEIDEKTARLMMSKVRAARLGIYDGSTEKAIEYLKELELFLLLRLSEK